MTVARGLILFIFFVFFSAKSAISQTESILSNKTIQRTESLLPQHSATLMVQNSLPTLNITITSVTANESVISISRTPSISPSKIYQLNLTSSTLMPSESSTSISVDSSSESSNKTASIQFSSIPFTSFSASQSSSSVGSMTSMNLAVTTTAAAVSLSSKLSVMTLHKSSSSEIRNYITQSFSNLIRETNTPVPTVATRNSADLQYIGVGIGVALIIGAVVIGSIILYLCLHSKKHEYSTGNSDFRASVTVQRYNPNKEHYTVNSDSAFSSRGSSIRSSFGTSLPHKGRKMTFTSPDHVTAIINLEMQSEMYSTPL